MDRQCYGSVLVKNNGSFLKYICIQYTRYILIAQSLYSTLLDAFMPYNNLLRNRLAFTFTLKGIVHDKQVWKYLFS